MNRNEWIDKLTIEDLPNEDMVFVANACGLEVAIKLLKDLPGLAINIPKTGMRKLVNKYVCENYSGHNAKELALECGLSIRQVYNVLDKKRSVVLG